MLAGCPDPGPGPITPNPATGDYPAPPDYRVEELEEGTAAASASPCGVVCEHLRAIECSDGYPRKGVSCYRGCLSMAKHQQIPTRCWLAAASLDDVRACGGIRCLH